jgi:hypothetical protein
MDEAPEAHRELLDVEFDDLDRSPDDFVSKLIHTVHLCALGGLSG